MAKENLVIEVLFTVLRKSTHILAVCRKVLHANALQNLFSNCSSPNKIILAYWEGNCVRNHKTYSASVFFPTDCSMSWSITKCLSILILLLKVGKHCYPRVAETTKRLHKLTFGTAGNGCHFQTFNRTASLHVSLVCLAGTPLLLPQIRTPEASSCSSTFPQLS